MAGKKKTTTRRTAKQVRATTAKQNRDPHAPENNQVGWVDAHPDVVYAFEQGIRFGLASSGRKAWGDPNHGQWTPDEWRTALKYIVDTIKLRTADTGAIAGQAPQNVVVHPNGSSGPEPFYEGWICEHAAPQTAQWKGHLIVCEVCLDLMDAGARVVDESGKPVPWDNSKAAGAGQ